MGKKRLAGAAAAGGLVALLVAATVAWAAADKRNVQMLSHPPVDEGDRAGRLTDRRRGG